ncbi:GNAT family N-acetyltransferase [Candidatus Clostridium stratigraminis]|uniref:GNAT family N-acetyltransferase n=1 Tax=Candidatus Clostridium stratigraminis TaxID=3381661 RepID=A0ABW8T516_9CLOT
MINYKRCSEVDLQKVYDAFSIGFSDYIIKIEMPMDVFIERFFGAEGNSLETSFIALDNERPIGLVLGGVKVYEGIKTMRCGTMAIDPSYRGLGVSKELMRLHRKEAIKKECKQLFLEVIVGNDRAINFYKKTGYEKIYDLYYFSTDNLNIIEQKFNSEVDIKEINFQELKSFSEKSIDVHINWQNAMDYIEKLKGQKNYGVYFNNELVAVISANINSKINYIYVAKKYRGKNIAASLIRHAIMELNLSKLSIGLPNNASIIGFLKKIGFSRDNISQYEMYCNL